MSERAGHHNVPARATAAPLVCAFRVDGPPQPKERARRCPNGRHVTPQKTRDYERLVGNVASLCRPPNWRLNAAYRVELRAYFGDRYARDVDNVAKAVLDGLNRVLWHDDRQVTRLVAEKAVDPFVPRVEVRVELVEPVDKEQPRRLYARGKRNERRQLELGGQR